MIQHNTLALKYQDFIARLQFQYTRIKKHGFFGVVKRLSKRLFITLLAVLLLPVSLIYYFLNYRRFVCFTDRIGHLAIEPDSLLKSQILGLVKTRKWFIIAPKHRIANMHLMKYWLNYFRIYQTGLSCLFFSCISWWSFMRYDASSYINNSEGSQLAYQVNQSWGYRPPILTLTEEDNRFGDDQLAKLGIPQGAWFACIHAREGGFSPVDEVLHAHRNGKIDYLIPAIEEVTRRGGWVIRLGDPTMVPLRPMQNVIDYAHHSLRSARLDVILCAKARFILGNTSGIFLVGSVFGTPSALVNMIPMPTLGFIKSDLSIPKLYRLGSKDRYLSFQEVMSSPISTHRYASLYEKSKITVEENSPEDILDITIEMLDRLDAKFVLTEEDEQLHQRYMSLFEPCHYSYGAVSRIGRSFLRRHESLLRII